MILGSLTVSTRAYITQSNPGKSKKEIKTNRNHFFSGTERSWSLELSIFFFMRMPSFSSYISMLYALFSHVRSTSPNISVSQYFSFSARLHFSFLFFSFSHTTVFQFLESPPSLSRQNWTIIVLRLVFTFFFCSGTCHYIFVAVSFCSNRFLSFSSLFSLALQAPSSIRLLFFLRVL